MAVDRKWSWSSSPFEGPSKKSDENALKQIIFHDAAIAAKKFAFPLDTDYPIWYDRFHPLRGIAESNFEIVYGTSATGKSQRQIVKECFDLIRGKAGKAHDWLNRTM